MTCATRPPRQGDFVMSVERRASVQYNDMVGTVALDDADFERYEGLLGLGDEWVLLGLSLFAAHPSLGMEGKDFASSSFSSLVAWCLHRDVLPADGGGLPALFVRGEPIPLTEFSLDTQRRA